MNRFGCLLAVLALSLATRPAHGQTAAGQIAVTFPFDAAKVLADPARARVYATVPATGSVAVIDTTTLQVVAAVPVGTNPGDMAISPDGNTLYIADAGTTAAIDVLDLTTLTTRPSLGLTGTPLAIAAGLDGRMYVAATNAGNTAIYQIDGTTGAVQTTFNANAESAVYLQISPDGKTLFAAGISGFISPAPVSGPNSRQPRTTDSYPTILQSFDVSTAMPVALQTVPDAGNLVRQLVASHGGQFLCAVCIDGNNSANPYVTDLFAAADLTSHPAVFNGGEYAPEFLAFSPDDASAYLIGQSFPSEVVQVFDTSTGAKTAEWNLPAFGTEDYDYSAQATVVDSSGSYLFINEGYSFGTGLPSGGELVVLTTGRGTLPPPAVAPAITSDLDAYVQVNTAFTYQITASYLPTSFNATSLPTGLGVDPASGVISGTPTVAGTFAVQISATNATGTGTATLTLTVEPPVPPAPVITSRLDADGYVGIAFSYQITATNSPTSFYATTLPDGLSLNSGTGLISGTPTSVTARTATISAYNEGGSGMEDLQLTIHSAASLAPVISANPPPPTGTVGQPYFYTVTATNSPTSFSATYLPPGLNIDPSSGVISGTPTAADQYDVSVKAANAYGIGSRVLILNIEEPPTAPPVIAGATSAAGEVGVPFTYQIMASNAPTFFNASPLPAGLSVNSTTGLISGTPTAAGTFALTIGAMNSGGFGQAPLTLTFTVVPAPIITSATTAKATIRQAFTYQIAASGTPTGFDAVGLPSGLSVDHTIGLISGAPTAVGAFNVTLSATNAGGSASGALLLTVGPTLPTVDVAVPVPRVTAGSGDHAEITISRSGNLSQKLTVAYSIKGSARNGTDYFTISGRQKIKPNKTSATIQIIPEGTLSGDEPRVVKITLLPGEDYQLGPATKAKVKIVP